MSTTASPRDARPRWPWLMMGSIAVNLFFLGIVAAVAFAHLGGHHGPFGGPGGPPDALNLGRMIGGEPGLRAFARTLPPERRAVLRSYGDLWRQSVKPLRAASQKARAEALAAMQAEPFDAERVTRTMNDLITADIATRRAVLNHFVTIVGQMTPIEWGQFLRWRREHELNPPLAPKRPEPPDANGEQVAPAPQAPSSTPPPK